MLPMEHRKWLEIAGMFGWTSGLVFQGMLAYVLRGLSWRYLELALAIALVQVFLVLPL